MKRRNRSTKNEECKYVAVILFLLLTIQFTIAAQDQDSPVVGKWKKHLNGATMTFVLDKDMNYTVDFEGDGNVEVRGTFKIDGNQITFNDKPGGYASPDPGIYNYKIENDKITFVIKEDPTVGRSGLLAGTWTKAKE